MRDPKVLFIHSPEIEAIAYPEECPFKTQRAGRTRQLLASLGLLEGPNREERAPVQAHRGDLERFHKPDYLDELERAARGELTVEGLHMGLGTDDCPVFEGMYESARWACGASLLGAEVLLEGEAGIAFNPSGGFHHAMSDRASGFCYANDVVLACLRLAEAGKRVLFLDVDAHHGDGVQAAFYDRADVMVVSIHESGKTLYPGTGFVHEIGEGPGLGYTLNVPLPPWTYDEAYLSVVGDVVLPVIRCYGPDVLVLELGMDTLKGDPLTHLCLTNNVHGKLLAELRELDLPLLVTGGGGYHVEHTVRGWSFSWQVLCGEQDEHDAALALGGVLLGSSEWAGGLRDPVVFVDEEQRAAVDSAVKEVIEEVKRVVFPRLGLGAAGGGDR